MSSNFKIQISNPCHEKWGEMIDNNTGKFCNSCQKSVVDFTDFSDRDLHSWFTENQGKSCGRFKPEQLDRLIHVKSSFAISRFKPCLIAASLFAFLSFPKLGKGEVIKPSTVQTAKTITNFDKKNQDEALSDSLRFIKGKVTDKDKSALPGVTIRILGEKYGYSTDANGEFSLTYIIQKENDFKELDIRYIGFENKNVKFKSTEVYLNIILNEDTTAFMGDVVIVRTPFWKRIYSKMRNQLRDINPFYKK
ncbi:carboxypeptidase-like regulatory domain-containing protein [Pedobacter kyonggii]|uniref:Carboxypeptidase-like regulatory domain-containing protein n=1 Tax=Pedobacter kyonggii TaxID=1926871 RepID=A0A4Q9HFW7_9SPHI|nr:carboxypeptidase-like regulatory domain-containing protein [Pedobacter kyonggii]TBO43922.1 carboxypeptidase-like regulatory domain-containing protein [Pedobacter kyonggii]